MSRRREAADLARALLLSTQEASTVAHITPHPLSSSSAGKPSQDSREMELKAVAVPAPAPSAAPTLASSAGVGAQWGMPPSVMTYAQEHTPSSPRTINPPSVLPDSMGSAPTPSHEHLSNIVSFTPTRTPTHGPAVRVPATSEITPSHTNTASPIHRLTPTAGASASGSGSNGSNNTKLGDANNRQQPQPPYSSSPSNGPIPSSRLSNGNPSHVSSSGSSHRNLFPSLNPSLTQTSTMAGPSAVSDGQSRKVVITYGKNQNQKEGIAGMLATIPDVTIDPRRRLSPTKAIVPVSEAARRRVLSPDEPEEDAEGEAQEMVEIEEQVEHRPVPVSAPAPAPRSAAQTVEVVVPSRSAARGSPPVPEKSSRKSPDIPPRHHSPDPLDFNIFRPPTDTPSTAAPASSGLSALSPVKSSTRSVAPSSRGNGKAMTPGSTARSGRATTTESQSSETSGPVRISKRVQVQREKEEAEKEARREARRIRKEKERMEAERKEAELRRAPKRGRGEVDEEDEEPSILALDGPAKKTPGRRGTRSPLKRLVEMEPETEADEVVVAEEETLVPAKPALLTAEKEKSRDDPAEKGKEGVKGSMNMEEHGDDEAQAGWSRGSAPGSKKRKRMILDAEDNGEAWPADKVDKGETGDDQPPQPAEILEPDVTVPTVPPPQKKGKKAKATPKSKGKGKGKKGAEATTEAVGDEVDQGATAGPQVDEGKAAADKFVEPKPSDDVEDEEVKDAGEAGEDEGATKSTYLASKGDGADQTMSVSPTKSASSSVAKDMTPRPPLKQSSSSINTPARESPGPSNVPGGIKWKTPRSDLASVLSKFGGARQSGMSRRSKIVSLHSKIGPPVKALPPPPPKPSKKKKDEEEDEEDSDEAEMESDGEGGLRRKKKERGMEWYMVED